MCCLSHQQGSSFFLFSIVCLIANRNAQVNEKAELERDNKDGDTSATSLSMS